MLPIPDPTHQPYIDLALAKIPLCNYINTRMHFIYTWMFVEFNAAISMGHLCNPFNNCNVMCISKQKAKCKQFICFHMSIFNHQNVSIHYVINF